jgi:murein DD-endopeptidase MepM/ murein hydrolase activator NlpD
MVASDHGHAAGFLLTCGKTPMAQGESAILAETTPSSSRAGLLRWALGLSSVPLLGVVAAFGIAPDTNTDPVALEQVVQELALPLHEDGSDVRSQRLWREERIQRGDTVGSLLARLQVEDREALSYLHSAKGVRSLYRLVPGRTVRAVTTGDGSLLALRYLHADDTELVVSRRGKGFLASEEPIRTESQLVIASGRIETSLFAATDNAGLSDMVAVQLAEIFSSEVDFHRDLRPGDRFSVIYESLYSNGEFVRAGRIVAAEFVNDGRVHRAVYFQAQGRGGYYTPEGRNVRKSFLRSPLEFSRISSGFARSRLHPVLRTWRAHRGVDYAAPVGTRAKATAEGTVQFAGYQGGYGKVVILRHSNGRSTLYGHLSRLAKGLSAGRRVHQGEVIGYVGTTGLATGPHLHYEFRVNGVHQNPLRVVVPPGPPITSESRTAFEETAAPLLQRLDLIRDTDLAMMN